jgi:midasin (ATPase involved in ribosome maturation)
LVGSYSLINGNTVWVDGPILKAYRSGGILLLDEIDLNPTLMVLQGVLENKPLYVFQTGELVRPKKGFQVFATGNTKGDGSNFEYVGTTTLNKAFLERFDWIVEQKVPTIKAERRIIERWLKVSSIKMDEDLLNTFFKFVDIVWKSWQSGDASIFLSTRRIQSIIKGWTICESMSDAIELALAHYSDEEAKALVNVWKAIDDRNAPAGQDADAGE